MLRFTFGIEHEVAFINREGRFADYLNTPFADFDAIIAQLPFYESDYPQLRIGDAGIKRKRWYIEGFERFSADAREREAELSLLPAVRRADPSTLVIADGTSCRHQIHDRAGREALHVARVLAMSLDRADTNSTSPAAKEPCHG